MTMPKPKPLYEVDGTYEKQVMDAWDRLPTPTARKIYVASSWRNPIQPDIVKLLRGDGHEVYDFRNPAPGNSGFAWSQIDPAWLGWEPRRFAELLTTHPVAADGFAFDKGALDWCDTCVMVLPCGRSAHLEAGYACGQGKRVIFYLHPDRFEPELMYLLGTALVDDPTDLLRAVRGNPTPYETRRQQRMVRCPS